MNGSYQFTYSVYQRPFRQPLQTSHGVWKIRDGIIIQLTDDSGRSHQGEIAPIPWFGSELIDQAASFCKQVGDTITIDQIYQIPDHLPTCQFGFGSALVAFDLPLVSATKPKLEISALLPAGIAAIDRSQFLLKQGYQTFKWKIGVLPITEEIAIWRELIITLPNHTKLRLDANGGLTEATATQWLNLCAQEEARIEFIEQPLAPSEITKMIELAADHPTPIALDESVATFDRLQHVYNCGWRGIYVIKPGIAGFPWRLAEFIHQHHLDVVFSSVMETSVGRAAAFQLATSLNLDRSMGFGTDNWYE
jgi:o-succinylbenzoate synthase